MPLPTIAMRRRGCSTVWRRMMKRGSSCAAARHREAPGEPFLRHALGLPDLDLQRRRALGQAMRAFGQELRRGDRRRLVHQVAGAEHAVGDAGERPPAGAAASRAAAATRHQREALRPRAGGAPTGSGRSVACQQEPQRRCSSAASRMLACSAQRRPRRASHPAAPPRDGARAPDAEPDVGARRSPSPARATAPPLGLVQQELVDPTAELRAPSAPLERRRRARDRAAWFHPRGPPRAREAA